MLFRRHLQAIAALPFVVTVVIPVWLARRNHTPLRLGHGWQALLEQAAGVVLLGCGLWLFIKSLSRFATEGEGTLAPWDPPRRLVVSGVYRYVRNPMISGVIQMLLGESLILLSHPHFTWALLFIGINAVYIPLMEEPFLLRRFGEDYREYCRHVPRLIPRLSPWKGNVP
jgi:protein-S-isoprenylcysteine O-methyltransferase Ste14